MRYVLFNCNMSINGVDMAGQVAEFSLPKITKKTEEIRNCGMQYPIEVPLGYEKLEASFETQALDPLLLAQANFSYGVPLLVTMSGALRHDTGGVTSATAAMRAAFKSTDFGSFKPGDLATIKYELSINEIALEIGGVPIFLLSPYDIVAGAVSQTAEERTALLTQRTR